MNENQPQDPPSVVCPYCQEKVDLDTNLTNFLAQTGVDGLRLPCPKCGSSFIYDRSSKLASPDLAASHSVAIDFEDSCPICKHPLKVHAWLLIDADERPDLVRQIGRRRLNMVECKNCQRSGGVGFPLLVYQGDRGLLPVLFSPIRHLASEEVQVQLNRLLSRIQQSQETGWIEEKILCGIMIVDREQLPEALGVDLQAILEEFASAGTASVWDRVVIQGNKALEILDPVEDKEMRARVQFGVGRALLGVRSERPAETIEDAIHLLEAATEGFVTLKPSSEVWAGAELELGIAYSQRIKEERAGNLEKAIYHLEKALTVFTPGADLAMWATAQHNLATAYKNRQEGKRKENLDQAAGHYQQALEAFHSLKDSEGWADAQNNLANLLCDRGDQFIEEAIEGYRQALTVRTREAMPDNWAQTMNNLAIAYSDRIQGDPVENGKTAIGLLQEVLRVYTHDNNPEIWATAHYNLGKCHVTLFPKTGDQTHLADGVFHCQEALRLFKQELFPAQYVSIQRAIGLLYFFGSEWEKAHTALAAAIEVGNDLLAEAYTETGRRAEVAALPSVYTRDAYCLLRLNRPEEAFVRLEQGRARLLAERLAVDELDLSNLPESQAKDISSARQAVRELDRELSTHRGRGSPEKSLGTADALQKARLQLKKAIQTARAANAGFMTAGLDLGGLLGVIPDHGALVTMCITAQGSAVFVVPQGETRITTEDHVIRLDGFTDRDFRTLLFGVADSSQAMAGPERSKDFPGWLPTYLNQKADREAWLGAIQTTCRRLWDAVFGAVHQRLTEIGLKPKAPVLLLPEGGLNLLPLHAAWREVDGHPRYFADDYTVSYAPSGYALSVSRQRLQEPQCQQCSLLAMVNPTADLAFADIEGKLLSPLFNADRCQVLVEKKANWEAFVKALPGKAYLHFACHGYYNWDDSLRSGLILADKAPLTLADIIAKLDLSGCRLVVLSACETGITDISQSPDEYFGLPAGFLQAGAPAVVSALWAVNDLSTAILFQRFYHYHIKERLEPAIALNWAQCWLREATAATMELAGYYEKLYERSGRIDIHVLKMMRYYRAKPDSKPFENPYYWAGFIFSGA